LSSDSTVGLLLAEHDKEIVGFVHVMIKESPNIPVFIQRRYAVVDSIFVKSGFQNQGIGMLLMDHAQEWSIDNGATMIELNVYEFNVGAISFYKKCGYQSFSRRMARSLKQAATPLETNLEV
jgi:ribosomal protein S18 acetylase RimI-like enzyme